MGEYRLPAAAIRETGSASLIYLLRPHSPRMKSLSYMHMCWTEKFPSGFPSLQRIVEVYGERCLRKLADAVNASFKFQ
jgi:hypothetical protein